MSEAAEQAPGKIGSRPSEEQSRWVKNVLGLDFLQQGSDAPVQAAGGLNNAKLEKARQAWRATRKKVSADVAALQGAVVDTFASRGLGPQLGSAYQKQVAWVLDALDEPLTAALDEVVANKDPLRHAGLVADAREAIDDYRVFVNTDKVIAGLDQNPFGVKLAIKATLTATLSALAKAVV